MTRIPDAPWPAWSPQRPREGDTYLIGAWGQATVQTYADETDVLIEFDVSSLKARSAALTFARTLVDQVQEKQPGMRAMFVAADDHYHVQLKDFGSRELRAAHGLYEQLKDFGSRKLQVHNPHMPLPKGEASSARCACCPSCLRARLIR